ncbi:E3 ubiquitin-protein ligase listerin isoform X2 [Rosa chinensis]|uniref:E3 ubiquitin-protein ligase listerin isoform X2 n=1 Tax=Rosa chinensis TaxID=74649 RepID=UPI000D094B46|nr:E3 ubiquitin-protein ligase listerin isoform X2 [Rosa chinensis]
MGKQKGDGARSKARPSSSSLAASLLPSGSAAAVGFGGYVGGSRLDAPPSGDDSRPFLEVDSDLALHLKRLARKDPTTKGFEYKRLVVDYNRDVRRATHDTMTILVTAVGRDLAPQLKSLMGPWWFSQFDPVSEVSQAAKRSFQAVFSAPEKRLDALILCTAEVFIYLEENLRLTPQNMSDKGTALDELQEMHQQVISSSLLALATLLDVLVCLQLERPGTENLAAQPKHALKARETAISCADKLFTAHKYFLDFLKSPSPAIRSATYSVLSSFIKNVPQAFNEGNMKTLAAALLGGFQEKDPACHSSMWDAILLFSNKFPESWTSVNVQKTVLNRFWDFLRNRCFGSQQVSYPSLVLFLHTVPSKAVVAETFFLEFFKNLWAGRNPSHSLNADRVAFFRALQECFLWALHNVSRYCNGVDSISDFQATLVKNVLVKLLWQDYIFSSSSRKEEKTSPGLSVDSCESDLASNKKTVETLNITYPMSYFRELANCIVGVLSGIDLLEHDLLSAFAAEFQENCQSFFQHASNLERESEFAERVIQFISLLGEHAMQNGRGWPLASLVGPMLVNSFALMRSHDSPSCVKILAVAVSVFGPHKIVHELLIHNTSPHSYSPDEGDRALEEDRFLQMFNGTFVPWCLSGNSYSLSARLDLLLALLDDEYFSEQWDSVIRYATNLEHSGSAPCSLDSDRITILAMLLQKVRNGITNTKVGVSISTKMGNPDHWHHELLESTAVAVARSSPPLGASNSQFLCTVVAGSTKINQISLVSRNTLILIFEEVFKKLLSFIMASSFTWVRDAGSLLTAGANTIGPEFENSVSMFEMAQFALEVLDGGLYLLKTLGEESGLSSVILAAIFLIDWEFLVLLTTIDDAPDDKSREKLKARLGFGESFHAFRCKISNQFWKTLSLHNRKALGKILIQCMRSAIFNEEELDTEKFTSLCCLWMLEILDCLSQDPYEEQNLLDQLLCQGDRWPLWIVPDFSRPEGIVAKDFSIQDFGHRKFISFIDKMISEIGIHRVVGGYARYTLPPSVEATYEKPTRSWLAAEILCSWKWPGGSAVASFLPSLSAYAKSKNFSSQESLVDFIFNILLDGTLVQGGCAAQNFVYLCPTSSDEVEDIEEPFLRALVAFLLTLFNDKIWGTEKAMELFALLVNKLYVGEATNANCLRILPLIVNVLIQPLSQRSIRCNDSSGDAQHDSSGENHVQVVIEGWLKKALSFPPLIMWWQTGEDMEDWMQLVISCYPISAVEDIQTPKLEREISSVERKLLLELFRKQRHGVGAPAVINQLPVVQMLLSKLMVVSVGYCWKEFDEEDWEFVLSQIRRWLQSIVVMMEEIAENVNDTITSSFTSDNLDDVVDNLGKIVFVSDPFPIDIAKNALLSFSLSCGPFGRQQAEDADNLNPVRTERWDPLKNRILEGILRLLFCTGIAEAIASSCCHEAAFIVSAARFEHSYFWELVALNVVNSSTDAIDRAVKSVEFWGLSKGPISSLYAILFSAKTVPLLQFAAYFILSTELVLRLAIVEEDKSYLDGVSNNEEVSSSLDMSTETDIHLRAEISCMIEKLPSNVLEMDLVADQRVHVFLAWSLLLSHLGSLPSSSPARERLVQYVQDSANPVILDCLFQHIPLELWILKKKDEELPAGIAEAAAAATRSIRTGSLLFSVQSLWPVEPLKMASLAGAMFGLMLHILPAYVRQWSNDLRDRSTLSGIESFTRAWCSPHLIAGELSQIKKDEIADENFTIAVSKSANEVVATYTKDETAMNLVIRLPSSYPLRPVDVDCTRSLGISEAKQRKWSMSMTLFVRNQNGALAEAIRIWKRNFDKEFEGVEECPICYSVIHTVNHALPRLACKTCKHKFHSACLYKWFSTSHKSTCPLCQSPF